MLDVQMVERMKLCARGMNLEDHSLGSRMVTKRTTTWINHSLVIAAARGEERTFLRHKEVLLVSGKIGIMMRRMSMRSMDPSTEASAKKEMSGVRGMIERCRSDLSELAPPAAGFVLDHGCKVGICTAMD